MEKDISGIKVLVVDDSKTIRRSAEMLLQKAGCEVFTAEDGYAALGTIVDQKPDIIFMDIMMPRLDGYQTVALVKNNPEYDTIPIVMLSSKDGVFDKERGRIVGAIDYITKPFSKEDLIETIKNHWNVR